MKNEYKEKNFDAIYNSKFNKVYQELSTRAISILMIPTKNTLLYKRDSLIKEFEDARMKMTMKEVELSFGFVDTYTERLLNEFKNHLNDYEENKITNFIVDHLENIKSDFKDSKLEIPSNIKLNATQTVEFIAKYDVFNKIIPKLYSIERNDTIEICEKKLSIEGYVKPANENSEEIELNIIESNYSYTDQAAALKREFTTARQVLAIKYLFQFAGIKEIEYDKTELAHFIRFLTSKELGNTKIQNTGIYKKVKNPYKDKDSEKNEDLKYIRVYFQKLNLTKIVMMINEEIDSNQ